MRHLVITVHGIRTFGQWQERLAEMIQSADPSIDVRHYRYGYFSIIAFLIPVFRWMVTRRFRRELLDVCKSGSYDKLTIVGHSFGTHLIGWALNEARDAELKVDTVILAGSVLRSNFPWRILIDKGVVRRVVNDCGIDDNVLVINQLFVLLTGMAGRVGFNGLVGGGLTNRYFAGGHSHYFEATRENTDSNTFMAQNWLPLIVSDAQPQVADQRPMPGVLSGISLSLMQIADPIKLLAYVGIPALLLHFFVLKPQFEAQIQAEESEFATTINNLAENAQNSSVQTDETGAAALIQAASTMSGQQTLSSELVSSLLSQAAERIGVPAGGSLEKILSYRLMHDPGPDKAISYLRKPAAIASGSSTWVIFDSSALLLKDVYPGGYALSPDRSSMLIIGANGQVVLIDTQKKHVVATVPLNPLPNLSSTPSYVTEHSSDSEPYVSLEMLDDIRLGYESDTKNWIIGGYRQAPYIGGADPIQIRINSITADIAKRELSYEEAEKGPCEQCTLPIIDLAENKPIPTFSKMFNLAAPHNRPIRISERALWREVPSSADFSAPDIVQRHYNDIGRLLTSDEVTRFGLSYPLGTERYLKVGDQEFIIEWSVGPQLVFVQICRAGSQDDCLDVGRCHGNYCAEAVDYGRSRYALTSVTFMGDPVVRVVDLKQMKAMRIDNLPRSDGTSAAFAPKSGELLIYSAQGNIWRIDPRNIAKPHRQLFNGFMGDWTEIAASSFNVTRAQKIGWLRCTPIVEIKDIPKDETSNAASNTRIERDKKNLCITRDERLMYLIGEISNPDIHWITPSISGISATSISATYANGIFVLATDKAFIALDESTGFPLTDLLTLSNVTPTIPNERLISATTSLDGRIRVTTSHRYFERKPPLTQEEIAMHLQGIDSVLEAASKVELSPRK